MNAKKKLAAMLTTLMIIISIFAVLPFPVQAQAAAVSIIDFAVKDPGNLTAPTIPTGGGVPMNLVLTNKANGSLMGYILITAVYLVNVAGVPISIDEYTVGLMFNPAVLKITGSDPTTYGIYNTTISGALPPCLFQGQAISDVMTKGVVNSYAGYMANYTVTGASNATLGVGAAVPLLYITWVMKYWGQSSIDFTVTASSTQTTVTSGGLPSAGLVDWDGNFVFSVHKVVTSAGFDAYWGDPPPPYPSLIGENLTVTVSIKNTEVIHSWEINISYFPSVLSVPSDLLVVEGPYFKVVELPTGINDTFVVTRDNAAGWIHVNCTALSGKNRTGDGLLMAFVGYAVGYGVTPFAVTSFNAVDCSGATVSTDLETETGGFKFQKAPIVAMIDTGTGLPLMKSWTYPTHTIGETFLAALSIVQTSEQVHSWKAGFTFNPRVLQVNWIADAGYLGGNGVFTAGSIDNVNGVVSGYNGTDAAGDSGTGAGALMLVNFTVLDYGVSEMDMTDANVTYRTCLLDLAGQPIETPSGLVSLTPDYTEFKFRAAVDVSFATDQMQWIGGTAKTLLLTVGDIGNNLQFNVTINTMENITAWQVGFRFNKDVLSCTSVSFGDFLSSLPGSVVITTPGFIDNTNGIVTAHGQNYQDAKNNWTKGTGVLLIVNFTVLSAGVTQIELTDAAGDPAETVVLDRDGNEVWDPLYDSIQREWGDINGIGGVSIADVKVLDLIYSGISPNPDFDPWGAFVTYNLIVVSIADVKVLDLIYSLIPPPGPP